jgi:hypothetical protein
MSLESFERKLRALIGGPTDLRPFVCDGSPLDCTIFLVGINPATSLEMDFWDFWESNRGYDKKRWSQELLAKKAAKLLAAGKKFRPAFSNTRQRIEAFVEAAGGAPVLETNIYAMASRNLKSLAKSDRNTAPFKFLVETIRPKIIVVHGKDAERAIAGAIAKLHVQPQVIPARRHFSRISFEEAKALGALAASLAV